MIELSEERYKKDLNEIFYYGICSTYIYIDYREIIDKQLKREMINIRNHCTSIENENCTDEKLFERYQQFWTLSEQSLQKFYEKVQEILAVPEHCVPNPQDLTSSVLDCANEHIAETNKLQEEVEDLVEKYVVDTYFVGELKHRQIEINGVPQILVEQLSQAILKYKKSRKKIEPFEKSREKMLQMCENNPENTKEAIKMLAECCFVNKKANLERFKTSG